MSLAQAHHESPDFILPFQLGDTGLRGRVIRLSDAITTLLNAHNYSAALSNLTGDAACLAAMMGSSLKFDGKLIFQAQGDGPVSLAVADYKSDGTFRAMVKADRDIGQIDTLSSAFGKGQIAITIDQGTEMERYQGITPLEGASLNNAAENYFAQSEQIPTLFKTAVGKIALPHQGETWRAGGMMLQRTPPENPDGVQIDSRDDEQWADACAFTETIGDDELLDPSISAQTLLFRLFHSLDVRVFEPMAVKTACDCSSQKIGAVLSRYKPAELSDMVEHDEITVTCEFCNCAYRFDPAGKPIGVS